MTQDEMYKNIQQFDKEIQRHKAKRNIKLFLGVALIIALMCLSWFEMSMLDSLIIALVFSGLNFLSGVIIWIPFIRAVDREEKQLEEMKNKYEKEFNSAWY